MLARHEHSMADARIVRHDETDARLVIEPANDLLGVALEDFDDGAFGPASMIDATEAHGGAIAMHGLEHLSWREVDGRRTVLGQQEPVPVLVRAYGADDERQALAQTVLIAPIADDDAGLQQLLQLLSESFAGRGAIAIGPGREFIELQRSAGGLQHLGNRRLVGGHSGSSGRRIALALLRRRAGLLGFMCFFSLLHGCRDGR
jgi:hypothetical protein